MLTLPDNPDDKAAPGFRLVQPVGYPHSYAGSLLRSPFFQSEKMISLDCLKLQKAKLSTVNNCISWLSNNEHCEKRFNRYFTTIGNNKKNT